MFLLSSGTNRTFLLLEMLWYSQCSSAAVLVQPEDEQEGERWKTSFG